MSLCDFYNFEDSEYITCPYCGRVYEPSSEDTYINGEPVDCFTDEKKIYTCEKCGKKFIMQGELKWYYMTETIDGECTEEEAKEKGWD